MTTAYWLGGVALLFAVVRMVVIPLVVAILLDWEDES